MLEHAYLAQPAGFLQFISLEIAELGSMQERLWFLRRGSFYRSLSGVKDNGKLIGPRLFEGKNGRQDNQRQSIYFFLGSVRSGGYIYLGSIL